jgi:hypothetical protein
MADESEIDVAVDERRNAIAESEGNAEHARDSREY